jgi:hypothetical protein
VLSDHIDVLLPSHDEKERHAELIRRALVAVPIVLFQYGTTRPLPRSIVFEYDGRRETSGVAIKYTLPFERRDGGKGPLCHALADTVRKVGDDVAGNALLTKVYESDDVSHDREHQSLMRHINERWRENLDKDGQGSSTGSASISPMARYIIPFVIISRMGVCDAQQIKWDSGSRK